MDNTIEKLILDELQENRKELKDFRAEVAGWRTEMASDVAELKVKSADISGNGQPGRMKDLEGRTTFIERAFWIGSGFLAAVDLYLGLLAHGILGHKG